MKAIKNLLVYFLLLILLTTLTSCTENIKDSSKSLPIKGSYGGWDFTIEEYHINESLKDISTTVNYGGVSTSNEISQEPESGKVFLLIKMVIEKKQGSETIDWSKMKLTDSKGNSYSRLHDSFLENFGFKRMKGTTLSFGKNEGWIAFEVYDDSKEFKLQYLFDEETVILNLNN